MNEMGIEKVDDERDSLNIIKNHLGMENQAKPIKKPYMVSVYARKEYMDNAKKVH